MGLAAALWCQPPNTDKVLDVDLALAVAALLDRESVAPVAPESPQPEVVLVSTADFETCVRLINWAGNLLRPHPEAAEWLAVFDDLES